MAEQHHTLIKSDAPVTLDARLRAKVTLLTERLHARRKALLANTESTFQGEMLSLEARKEQYRALRSSPVLMLKSLAADSFVGADGRMRISRKTIDALVELSDSNV